MSKVRIVTDSTADIPAELREKLGIETVPLKVSFGEESFIDGVTITPEAFYQKLVESSIMPITSQPSPMEFLDMYKKLAEDDPETEIISIHLSSVMSGTYQSAVLAKSMLEDEEGNKATVHVVDSRSASYGIGAQVIAAAEAAAAGKSAEEILSLIEQVRRDTLIFFMVDTLEYLQKGGRIGKASALIGSLLNIKPILTIDDEGYVSSIDKVRGQKKALARIVELMNKDLANKAKIRLKLAHVRNPEAAETLKQLIGENFEVQSCDNWMIGPVIVSHTGPGLVAIFVQPA